MIANAVRTHIIAPERCFCRIARESIEDGSAQRGGDLGWLGRGRLAPAFEEAAFRHARRKHQRACRDRVCFHIIQRVE